MDIVNLVESNDVEGVRRYLLEGGDPNIFNLRKETILLIASSEGYIHVTRLLLQYGADPNMRSTVNSDLPIHHAVQQVHLDIVPLLLQYGADPNLRGHMVETPLESNSYNLSNPDGSGLRAMQYLLHYGADPNLQSIDGSTPLSIISEKGHIDGVQMLLLYGAKH